MSGVSASGRTPSKTLPADVPRIELYTDGACSGNPGPGGWACVLKHPATGSRKELSGGDPQTTNNRMELRAAIEGLKLLKTPTRVDLTSDSKYVLDGLSSWLAGWKKKGWKTASKQPVKNQDLWQVLDELIQMHEVHFHWIKGHSAHPENERCDQLAVIEARKFARD